MGVLYHGDCLAVLPTLAAHSIDACVSDPPYHLTAMTKRFGKAGSAPANGAAFQRHNAGFMGKAWDGGDVAFRSETWEEVFRVLKPGAHLLAFGGSRTYHRLACAIEDAGFEIRDCLVWLYGSGFPKSLNISKAIDKAAGAEREILVQGKPVKRMIPGADQDATGSWVKDNGREYVPTVTEPATAAAAAWDGWGTALKPAMEPIVLARKPLSEGNVASNVLVHGTGGINIDACRIDSGEEAVAVLDKLGGKSQGIYRNGLQGSRLAGHQTNYGRFPANVLLDEAAAILLDDHSGERPSGKMHGFHRNGGHRNIYGQNALAGYQVSETYGDTGGRRASSTRPRRTVRSAAWEWPCATLTRP